MVDRTGGQLYTIEGFAAALIMLITVYFVLGTTTTIYTPGDTHISDMQLEQLGTDALAMMDTPNTSTDTSNLAGFINNTGADSTLGPKNFSMMFLNYSDSTTIGTMDHIQFNATVYYRSGGQMKSYLFAKSPRDLTPGDHAVRVAVGADRERCPEQITDSNRG